MKYVLFLVLLLSMLVTGCTTEKDRIVLEKYEGEYIGDSTNLDSPMIVPVPMGKGVGVVPIYLLDEDIYIIKLENGSYAKFLIDYKEFGVKFKKGDKVIIEHVIYEPIKMERWEIRKVG